MWRRSGFWTTSFEGLDLDRLQVRHHSPHAPEGTSTTYNDDDALRARARGVASKNNNTPADPLPAIVRDTLPERERAGGSCSATGPW